MTNAKIRLWDRNSTLRAELPETASLHPLDPDEEPCFGEVIIPWGSPALEVDELTVTIQHYREDGTESHFWRSKPAFWCLDLPEGRVRLPWVNDRENEIRKPEAL